MVTTDDPALAARLKEFQRSYALPPMHQTAKYLMKLLLYHGMTEPHIHRYARGIYEHFGKRNPLPQPTTDDEMQGKRPVTYTQRLSNAQAVLGLRQLDRLDENVAHRRAIAAEYQKRLSEEGFKVPQYPAKANPAFVRYPVWVEDPASAVRVAARCATLGLWFTSVLEEAQSPACGDYEQGSCPRAESAARHLINLPTNPRVNKQDVLEIISTLARMGAMIRR
jgi:dTDP-4-amino-4,6-dideoxygalactose transaminase